MSGKGRIENLRSPWKPGHSGNPAGRPRRRPMSDRYRHLAEQPLPEERWRKLGLWPGATFGDAVVKSTFEAAIDGKYQAAREVREAIESDVSLDQLEAAISPEVQLNVVYDKAPIKNKNYAEGGASDSNTQHAEKLIE